MASPLTLVRDNPLTVQFGATEVLSTSANLDATDTDYSDAQLVYTVVSGPSDGVLLDNGVAATSFTQAALDNGLVSYRETVTSPSTDNFAFSVSDPGGNEISSTFNISIEQSFPLTQTVPALLTAYAALSTAVTGVQINYNGYSNEQFTTVVTAHTGSLDVSGNSGASVSGLGTGSVTITGTLGQVNAALKTLDYIGAVGGSTGITVTTTDLGDQSTVNNNINVIVKQAGTFTTIDDGGNSTILTGINNEGQIVGGLGSIAGTAITLGNALLYSGGTFTNLGAFSAQGINDSGEVVGYNGTSGVVYSGGALTTYRYANNPQTFFEGVNNSDEIVGYSGSAGFSFQNGIFQNFGPNGTKPFGINNAGQIVGTYSQFPSYGFVYSNGTFSTFSPFAPMNADARDINDAGLIVGWFVEANGEVGFVYNENNGSWNTIIVPGATSTFVFSINDSDQIVGAYVDANGVTHGFLGTVPPPYPTNSGNVDEWIIFPGTGQWQASAQPGSHPPGYQVAAVGDFTNSGTDGILWYNPSTGDVDEWKISDGAWAGSIDLGTHPGNFQVGGVGDFTGNGTDDVLWTSASGNGQVQTDIWELNNGQWAASVSPGSHPGGYQVAGIGDWTGDGTDGILWYNSVTGDVDEWQLSNGQWAGSVDLGSHPVNLTDGNSYQIAGIGDFFDSGIDDILWTSINSNGTIATDIWELGSNGHWLGSVSPGTHPAGYQVVGIGTGNFTGFEISTYILWQNPTTGDVDEWQIGNGQYKASVDLGVHPGNFQIAGIGDFTGSGTSDILWHSNT